MKAKPVRRINFNATSQELELIEGLRRRADLTKKDLIIRALMLLEWSMRQLENGRIICSVEPDNVPAGRVCEFDLGIVVQKQPANK